MVYQLSKNLINKVNIKSKIPIIIVIVLIAVLVGLVFFYLQIGDPQKFAQLLIKFFDNSLITIL